MNTTTHIDMTPTAEQGVRIKAYTLAIRLESSPYDFGDYWDYTEEESAVIIYAYEQLMAFWDWITEVGIEINKFSQPATKKIITAAISRARSVVS